MEAASIAWGTVCGVAASLLFACIYCTLRRRYCPPPAQPPGDGSSHRLPLPLSSARTGEALPAAGAAAGAHPGVWDHQPGSSDSLASMDSSESPMMLPTHSLRQSLRAPQDQPAPGALTALSLMQADKHAALRGARAAAATSTLGAFSLSAVEEGAPGPSAEPKGAN